MRIALFIFILLSLMSCGKEDEAKIIENNIIGHWRSTYQRENNVRDWVNVEDTTEFTFTDDIFYNVAFLPDGKVWRHRNKARDTAYGTYVVSGTDLYLQINFGTGKDVDTLTFSVSATKLKITDEKPIPEQLGSFRKQLFEYKRIK